MAVWWYRLAAKLGNASAQDEGGFTPLHAVAWNDRTEAVTALLNAGAHPNAQDEGGGHPAALGRPILAILHRAARRRRRSEREEQRGTDRHRRGQDGEPTPSSKRSSPYCAGSRSRDETPGPNREAGGPVEGLSGRIDGLVLIRIEGRLNELERRIDDLE